MGWGLIASRGVCGCGVRRGLGELQNREEASGARGFGCGSFTYLLMCLFIYFWLQVLLLHAGFLWLQQAGGYSLLQCMGFSLWWLLLLQSTGSRLAGFSSCSTQAQ